MEIPSAASVPDRSFQGKAAPEASSTRSLPKEASRATVRAIRPTPTQA